MKTFFSLLAFLFFFSFSGFGQVVDTAAVVLEVDSLIQVSRALTSKREFDKAIEVNAAAEKLALEKLGRETAAYSNACFNHGKILYYKRDYLEAEKWYLDAINIRDKLLGEEHFGRAPILNSLAILYMEMSNYKKSEPLFLEANAIREKALTKEHPDYPAGLNNLAILYMYMGDYEKAEPLYLEAISIREKILGKEHPDYAANLNSLAALYRHMGDYEKAEPLFLEAKFAREKAFGKEHSEYAQSLGNLAVLYQDMGNFEKAEPLHLEAIEIQKKVFGNEHQSYATGLNNLAILYHYMSNYEKAEPLLLETKSIWEKTLGKEHPQYAASLNNLAVLYKNMGNYEKAESFYFEANAIKEKALGKEHPEYAQSLNNLAVLYRDMGNYDKAEPLFLETKVIWENALGKESSQYAACLNNLAILYDDIGNYKNAEPLYIQANAIKEKALGKEHPEYAQGLNNLAILYENIGNYDKAKFLHLESKNIREKALGKEHPEYAQSLDNLTKLYWTTSDFDAAKSDLLEAGEVEKSLLIKATRHLSELELSSYVVKFTNGLNLNFSFAQTVPKISGACYDNTLFYKGFLINATSQVNKLALTDPAATENYNRLKSYHQRLAAEYAQPIAERRNVAELEEKANTLEKELTRTVAGFGEALRQVNWQEVQAALKPGEAAIEFIRFHYHNPKPTDSTLYAALLVKSGMESPAFISLFEEKQLETLLAPLAEQGSSGLNELYGGQAGKSLYRLLWLPIESHLTGVKTVYYSPSGLLHRFNIGAIPVTEGKILADRHELVCLSSTRQLVTTSAYATMAGRTSTAVVYGGIQFDMDSTAYPIQHNLQDDNSSNRRGLSFGQSDSTLRNIRGDSWQYLKWSEKEANNVQSTLTKAGVTAEARKGWQATEESFKQIGTKEPSPRILHVSTHGFFFPDPKSVDSRQSAIGGEEPVFRISDHPMIRSGLVLAGGNHAWKTGKPLGNREDGILTAYEISQLDLRNTDLVVLSACETGLGHIEGNEGVYGLQRAFKIAGAKYLVMSLWQVPDYQTQELMTAFYRNMLEKEMPVRQALHAAQDEMRQKRYEPFYWAGFVLVE